MRRVYDDAYYDAMSRAIMDFIHGIDRKEVTEYSYGMDRASVHKISQKVLSNFPIKFGRVEHANGIGNNNAIELIIVKDNEEQIFGLLHITDDMYGRCICWLSDIDKKRKTESRKI